MKRQGKFFTDSEGRVRYIGDDRKAQDKGGAKVDKTETAPQRGEKGQFITKDGRVIFIGGPGAGGGGSSGSGGTTSAMTKPSALAMSIFSSDLDELADGKSGTQSEVLDKVAKTVGLELVSSGRDVSTYRLTREHTSVGEKVPVGTLIGVQLGLPKLKFFYGIEEES